MDFSVERGIHIACKICAVLFLAACNARPIIAAPPPPSVEVARVSVSSGVDEIAATGTLRRRREMTLSFRIPGVITSLTVDDGDPVRGGQVLAAIDPTAVAAKLRQTLADLDRAQRDLRRFESLVDHGAISVHQVEAQRTLVADARSAYDTAAFDRRSARLVSPVSGVVLARAAQVGEVVGSGQAIVSVADLDSPLVLRAPLSDRDAGRLRLGARARVVLDALPGETLPGVVSRIGQRAEARSGAVEAEITVPPRTGLRSGLIGAAWITLSERATGGYLRVPAEALLEAEGPRAFVLRLDRTDMRAHRIPVGFGGFDGDDALVSGLAPGTELITAGAGYVSDKERVSVIDPARLEPRAVGAGR